MRIFVGLPAKDRSKKRQVRLVFADVALARQILDHRGLQNSRMVIEVFAVTICYKIIVLHPFL